jgi:hypothetical protein
MGKSAVLSVDEKKKKKRHMPTKNDIPVKASKILTTISPFYGVNPSVSTVLEIS